MNAGFMKSMIEFERAAEKAGGYVIQPGNAYYDPEFEDDFATYRRYCVEHKKRLIDLTEDDWKAMGIAPFPRK